MTFPELTRVMLSSMDFFELRRTAARYAVPYQGVRKQKLIRDLERKILSKSMPAAELHPDADDIAARPQYPEGAVSAKPQLQPTREGTIGTTRINTFSARNGIPRSALLK